MTRTKIQEYLFRFVDEGKYRTPEKLHLAFSYTLTSQQTISGSSFL